MENLVVLDCEVYPNYFLAAFKNIDNNRVVTIEVSGHSSHLSDEKIKKLKTIMLKRYTFGFNSNNYDLPIILYALRGKTCNDIYRMSERIIGENTPGWKTIKDFGLVIPRGLNHFDIQEPSPGVRVSLKLYGGRMHSKRLQDLPIEPGSTLSSRDIESIKSYCINDLDTTIDLYRKIEDRIKLRQDMSKQYQRDLMSKSDAQIAEVVIKSELQKRNPSKRLYPPKLSDNITFKYNVPSYIQFQSPTLKSALNIIRNHDFELDGKGSIKLPTELKKLKINLGYSSYQLGVGGIHSTEKSQTVIPGEDQILVDKDVASYYPSIILTLGLYPKHLGPVFLNIYKNLVDTRLKAKREGLKVINESLKIVINGSFGKLGSKYSALYSPDLMMTVTLTGQLALLMLIEQLEDNGINVMSANTDGFVSLMPKGKYEKYQELCESWQEITQFELEENRYKALLSRDVNNYLAITENDSKGKGIFTLNQLSKNPHTNICAIAVQELIRNGIPIKKTILECKDITQFLIVRSVTGGAVWKAEYLGKVVRWYYSNDGHEISYKKNGNKVAKSDGAKPIMELSDKFPNDIDYNRYIEEAESILDDIGYTDI